MHFYRLIQDPLLRGHNQSRFRYYYFLQETSQVQR